MKLLSPITIKTLEIRNRVVMAPLRIGIKLTSSQARGFYLTRAKGGIGAIIVGAISVDLLSMDDALGQSGSVESFLEGLHLLVRSVQETGTKIGIQLWQGNRFPAGTGRPEDTRGALVAPSQAGKARELDKAEIRDIIARFGKAARNAQRAGFDFVEVNGAHAYLPCQFFSPISNHRNDEYGGDLLRRMNFGIQCVTAMRQAAGDNYPIFWRLGAWDEIPDGITLSESCQFAAALVDHGVNVIDVSLAGMLGADNSYIVPAPLALPGMEQPEGTFVPQAEFIKKRTKVPVIAVGRFHNPELMEGVLKGNRADILAIGRQLIADPYWLEKVATGKTEEITSCIWCNSCFETRYADTGYVCPVNEYVCRESDLN